MINMLDFIGKNPEQVLNATEAYMMTVMDSMNASAEDKAQIKEGFAELKASEQDFVDGASDLSAMLKEIVKEPSVSMVLDSFKYNAEVKQLAEGFRSTEVYDVTHKRQKGCEDYHRFHYDELQRNRNDSEGRHDIGGAAESDGASGK